MSWPACAPEGTETESVPLKCRYARPSVVREMSARAATRAGPNGLVLGASIAFLSSSR